MTKNDWFFAGLTTSFPDIHPSPQTTSSKKTKLTDTNSDISQVPPCKVFQIADSASTELTENEAVASIGMKKQVLVFQYRGKFHAIDNQCPHRSYPLMKGTLHDIEDFGIVLSAGITCPKHGWAFDLHTGESDRGMYKMEVWDVELREGGLRSYMESEGTSEVKVKEVWMRRKRSD